jgi:hypothetical protein
MMEGMGTVTARVVDGRLVLNEPTSLPEGTVVELSPVDDWDALEDDDRERLHAALMASERDVQAAAVRPAQHVLAGLRDLKR